ncbi:hypothetical protein ACYX7E_13185 [Luteimonas sp. RIT-PG2_3]
MKLLHLFREVEPLFGGYWLLTPYRVIEVESRYTFIGAVPSETAELGNVQYVGLGRFVCHDVANQFPRQDLVGWMGLSRVSIEKQAKALVFSHQLQAAAAFQADDIEYFMVLGNGGRGRHFSWSKQPYAILAPERIALCRQRHVGGYRYFSGELRNGALATEAPVMQPLSRVMFALARFVGLPVVVRVHEEGTQTMFKVSERLPTEGYRLALLLANQVSRQGYTTTYSVDSSLAPSLSAQLSALGCALENSK